MPSADHLATARALASLAETGHRATDAIALVVGDRGLADNTAVAVLVSLWLDGPSRPSSLARGLGLTTGGMTKVIDRLEDQAFAERGVAPLVDGRGVLVGLTDKGRRMVEDVLDAVLPELTAFRDALVAELGPPG